MAVRDKIAASAAPLLSTGEQVQAVFIGQTRTGWWLMFGALAVPFADYRNVIVTDRRILVLDRSKWSVSNVRGVRRELPRDTQIGPHKGTWFKTESLGEPIYIAKGFRKDVERADALVPTVDVTSSHDS